MTVLIALLAAIAVVIFAVVAIGTDRRLRDEQLDADLLQAASRTVGLVGFTDGEFDLDALEGVGGLDDDVVIGVRGEFDVVALVDEQELWDEIPEFPDSEADEIIAEVIDELDTEEMAVALDLDEAADRDEMIDLLSEDVPDDIYDEAVRRYLLGVAEDEGFDLVMETELYRSEDHPLDQAAAVDAVERVADDDEDAAFDVGAGLIGRGVPLRSGPEVRGAVVAVLDRAASDADHAAFRRTISALGAALVAASAVAAWFVAGRTIQPAARSLAQQERFLADAAHELRTPIAAIRATAESGGGDPRAALDRVAVLATNAAGLTDDLLTLARIDADRLPLRFEPVRLDLLVEALLDGADAFRFTGEEAIVDADPVLLERAITNLLENAVSHGEASEVQPAEVVVSGTGVTVRDYGPGVEPIERDRIFERFRSAQTSTGHGLGLPLAQWIARAHGGDLTIDPATTVGTAFDLRLPTR